MARSVRFITGHLALEQTETDWQPLASGQETLVIYMGFSHLATIAGQLRDAGLPASTPFALVQNATTPRQRLVHGTLGQPDMAAGQLRLEDGPILVIVGETTRLAERINPLGAGQETRSADPLFWLRSA
jgi:siroheme synthase